MSREFLKRAVAVPPRVEQAGQGGTVTAKKVEAGIPLRRWKTADGRVEFIEMLVVYDPQSRDYKFVMPQDVGEIRYTNTKYAVAKLRMVCVDGECYPPRVVKDYDWKGRGITLYVDDIGVHLYVIKEDREVPILRWR